MTGNDVKNILRKYLLSNVSGVDVFKDTHPPVTKKDNFERIVVNTLGLNGNSWREGFANVNWFVPYYTKRGYDEPDGARMTEVEAKLDKLFNKSLLFTLNDEQMIVRMDSIKQEEEKQTFSYFINVKLELQITNF